MSSIGVDFILRASSAQFTKALASANNSIKDLKKGLREFDVGNGLKQALGIGGVIAGFRTAITNAQELRDEADKIGKSVDSGTRSVAELGDAVGNIGMGFKNALTTGLSFFTQVGDAARHFFFNVTQEQEDAARKMVATTGKAADEAEARLKKSKEDNSPEKQAAAQEELAKAQLELAMKGTEEGKKLALLTNERIALEEKLASVGKATVEHKKIQAEIAKNELETKKAAAALDKAALERAEKKKAETDKSNEKKKDLVGKFAPSVEEMAGMDLGGFFDGKDPRLKARKILEDENRAKEAFARGDFKGGFAAAQSAQGARTALENEMAGIKTPGGKAPPTAEQMDELIKAVQGKFKAEP